MLEGELDEIGYADGRLRRGWQYLYFVIAGVNVVPIIGGLLFIPSESPRTASDNGRIDWIGAVMITIALSLLSFSITQIGLVQDGWKTPCA